jgi:uncharacterized damage-inducible protein DinB
MATKSIQTETVSERLIGRWELVTQKLVRIAEEIPETRFDYRPVDDVRSCAEVLRHVAFWNLYVADRARGKKGDDTANELAEDDFSSKKQIISALKQSNTDAFSALKEHRSGLNPETAEMLVTFIEHNCEHYGELVVYARLCGIVPPASLG